ncbi:hypothetical protein [Corynebacterium gerontici]|uniref:Uncharacterized protein n=1 Tax=Corynebacterium gerontici TaxID=2079234 RepID=A0A3G6IY83_9CORY|nr:hypothetical protein [Corynebacterium gerontici]AZA10617.1 hypothetical protein CGERO_01415 [Corynebacterium gerontici]
MSLTKALVSTQFTLWKRLLKAQKMTIFQVVVVILYSMAAAVGLAFMLAFEGLEAMVGVSSLGIVLLWIFQYTVPSPEHQIDLERFIALPLQPRKLRVPMILIELIQSRGIAALGCSLITAVGGSFGLANAGHAGLIPVYVLGIAVSFGTALLGVAAIRTVSSGGSEKSRTYRGLGGALVFAVLYFALLANADWTKLISLSKYLAWTPFGAAIGPTSFSLEGNIAFAVLSGVLALVYLGACWVLILMGIRNELREVSVGAQASSKSSSSALMVGRLPYTDFWALVSRQIRYMRRDSRMVIGMVSIGIMALGFFLVGAFSDTSLHWTAGLLVMLLPTQGANIFGYNGPANWSVMVTPTKPSTQLRAETLSFGLISAPLLAMYIVALGFVESFSALWLAVSVAIVCGAAGAVVVSMLLSSLNAYPTSKPGTSLMKDRSGQNTNAMITGIVGLVAFIPLVGPGLGLMLYGANAGGAAWMAAGAAVCLVSVALLAVFGVRIALKRADRSMPEIFFKVQRWV